MFDIILTKKKKKSYKSQWLGLNLDPSELLASMLTTGLLGWPSIWFCWNSYLNLATYLIPPHNGELIRCSPSHSQHRPSTNSTCGYRLDGHGVSFLHVQIHSGVHLASYPMVTSGVKWLQSEADQSPHT
jgi:hypothetical protein